MGRELVVHCDIEPGWHETSSGWVFQESDRLDLPSCHPLRVSAKVIEHSFGQWRRRTGYGTAPVGSRTQQSGSLEEMCPSFSASEYELTPDIRLVLDGEVSAFVIKWLNDNGDDVNPRLPWRRAGHDWAFKAYHSGVYELPICSPEGKSHTARPFYIEIEAVLHEPPRPQPPPEYTEPTPFAPGGLPSLGKKR